MLHTTVHIDSSAIIDCVVSSYQRTLLDLIFLGDAASRDKVRGVPLLEQLSRPRFSHTHTSPRGCPRSISSLLMKSTHT